MTIAKRLMLLVAVPLVALGALGVYTRIQLSRIEERTRFVAESRIMALATLGKLSRSISDVRANFRNQVLATNQTQRASARLAFEVAEREATRLHQKYADELVVSDRGRRLLGEFLTLNQGWLASAKEAMGLADEERRDEAVALYLGPVSTTASRLSQVLGDWIDNNQELAVASGKEAITVINEFRWKMLAANSAALLLTGLLGFHSFRRIIQPIQSLEGSVKGIAAGDYAHEVPFTQAQDETGGLARSIEVLKQGAAGMEEQRWIKSNAAKLTTDLQGAGSLEEFGKRLACGLVPLLGGGVAAFYVYDERDRLFRRTAGYGLSDGTKANEAFALGVGLVGQCGKERKRIELTQLPPGYLEISSGLGASAPVQATAWPLLSKDQLLGVLEVATLRGLTAQEQTLLDEVLPVAGISLEVLEHNLRTRDLLDQVRASEERARLILESSAEGIFGTDVEGRVTFVNPAACQMLGFSAEELIGQPCHAALHHHRPDGSEYLQEECPMYAAYTEGKPSRIDDEFLWRKDGSGFPVEYGATPIAKDGVVIGSVVSFTDITERKQREAELQVQHSALEAAANAMAITDRKGIIQWVNPAFVSLTGFEREEAVGQNPRVLNSGTHDKEFFRNMWQTILAGSVWQGTLTNKRKDGVLYQEEMTITPVRSGRGEISHFVAVKQDITERLQAEQRLRETEQFFRSVLELAPDGLMVADEKGVIRLANAQCERLFGYTQDELIGQQVEMLVPAEVRPRHPAMRAAFHRTGNARAMGAGRELRGQRKDGSLFPVEIGLSSLPARQGQGAQVAVSIRDVTERKQAEAELTKRSEELKRTNFLADSALDLTKAGYWHIPLDGSGWYNSSERAVRIFGDPPAAGHRYTLAHWLEHVRLGDEAAAKTTSENFEAAVSGNIPVYDAIYAYKRPVDGRVVWIHALGHVVKDENGKPTDMYGVTQDITDFKLLEMEMVEARQKAEEATQMKSMFLANMSHEIRTPMNAIIGLSHLALKTPLNAKQRDYVSKVHNAGTSLLAVINDILDFSKIEAGKLDIETIDFKLDEVIGSVTTLTAQKAHDKGLEFLAHVSPDIPEHLLGDPLRLGQILTNFVNNAVKFTEQGEIRLNIELLERTGEKVQLKFSVRDTGNCDPRAVRLRPKPRHRSRRSPLTRLDLVRRRPA